MTSHSAGPPPYGTGARAQDQERGQGREQDQDLAQAELTRHVAAALRTIGVPNSARRQFDFLDDSYEWRRLFSELFGTFLLVLAAAGGGMVNARFGGHVTGSAALVVAPALTVAAVILFMGAVSGAHVNPAVSFAFALRGNFPWKRVPAYIAAQAAGAVLATLLLWALVGRHGSAGRGHNGDNGQNNQAGANRRAESAGSTGGLQSAPPATRCYARCLRRLPPGGSSLRAVDRG